VASTGCKTAHFGAAAVEVSLQLTRPQGEEKIPSRSLLRMPNGPRPLAAMPDLGDTGGTSSLKPVEGCDLRQQCPALTNCPRLVRTCHSVSSTAPR
jgi:hypothetical protein